MKLMIAKKQSAPVAIACIIAATCTAALANNLGSPGSALDPNNYVAPPASKSTIKAPRPDTAAGEPQEEIQSTTTFVTMPGFESPAEKVEKAAQKPGKVKSAPAKAAPAADDGNGLLSGVNDKFKTAGSGLASGTKAAGDSMKKGTKAVGGGIASGAKASGNFFMKGARAIGTGTKKMGSKVAKGAKAAGDTVKDGTHAVADKLPFTGGKSEKGDELKSVAAAKPAEDLKQEPVAHAKQEDLKPVGAPQPKLAATPKNMILKTEDNTNKTGIVGKTFGTFGKLNVFHKKNEVAPLGVSTAAKAPNGAEVTH